MRLRNRLKHIVAAFGMSLAGLPSAYALDSYRYLHVTIETPWTIFLFLLVAVLSPFILMAVLMWRFAERRAEPKHTEIVAEPVEK